VAGACQSGSDKDASVAGDADAGPDGSADGLDVAREKTSNIDANDGPHTEDARDVGDHVDAREADDAHEVNDRQDARGVDASEVDDTSDAADGGDAEDARPDTVSDTRRPPSPCFLPTDAAAAPTSAALPENLSGTWQLCTDAADLASSIRWMLGDTGTIQLDGVNWWRLAVGQTDHGEATFAGTYFRLLEGTRSVFEFVDGDVHAAGGATLTAGLFPGAQVLELMACDGAGVCNGPAARLVNVGGGSGQ